MGENISSFFFSVSIFFWENFLKFFPAKMFLNFPAFFSSWNIFKNKYFSQERFKLPPRKWQLRWEKLTFSSWKNYCFKSTFFLDKLHSQTFSCTNFPSRSLQLPPENICWGIFLRENIQWGIFLNICGLTDTNPNFPKEYSMTKYVHWGSSKSLA